MMCVEEIIKKLVLDLYGIEITKHVLILDIVEDSLTKIEFLFEVEKAIKCSIPHEEVLEVETFGDLFEIINKFCK